MPMHSSYPFQYSDNLSLPLNEICRTILKRNTKQSWVSQLRYLWQKTELDLFSQKLPAQRSEFLLMCPQLLQSHTRYLSSVRLGGDDNWICYADTSHKWYLENQGVLKRMKVFLQVTNSFLISSYRLAEW